MPRRVGSYTPEEASRFCPRPVRILLRDHRTLNARIHVPLGQPLTVFLAAQSDFTNLTAVRWAGDAQVLPHLAVRTNHVLWITGLDAAMPLARQSSRRSVSSVEVHLEDGSVIRAGLDIAERQRLSDYLSGVNGGFVPLYNARTIAGTALGDLAVNVQSIMVVFELEEAMAAA